MQELLNLCGKLQGYRFSLDYYLVLILFLSALLVAYVFWVGFDYFSRQRLYKKLKSTPFPKEYEKIIENIHQYKKLSNPFKKKLHVLILFFIEKKEFIGVKMEIDDEVRVTIAFYASLMKLGFRFDEKDFVTSIIVYPRHFIADERVLLGQSSNGTVVFSWQDISTEKEENVIIHEFAHELDFQDGFADGVPVLARQNYRKWSEVFSYEFNSLRGFIQKDDFPEKYQFLGSYAGTNEAEFFAVCSEKFFEMPKELFENFPNIYKELKLFYKFELPWR